MYASLIKNEKDVKSMKSKKIEVAIRRIGLIVCIVGLIVLSLVLFNKDVIYISSKEINQKYDYIASGKKFDDTATTTEHITKNKILDHIEIDKSHKYTYYIGDRLEENAIVKGYYDDESVEEISAKDLNYKLDSSNAMNEVGDHCVTIEYKRNKSITDEYKIEVKKPTIHLIYDEESNKFIASPEPECKVEWLFFNNDDNFSVDGKTAICYAECQTPVVASIKYNNRRYFSSIEKGNSKLDLIDLEVHREIKSGIDLIQLDFDFDEKISQKTKWEKKFSKNKIEIFWLDDNYNGEFNTYNQKEFDNWKKLRDGNCDFKSEENGNGLLVVLEKDKSGCVGYYCEWFG